MAQLVDAQVPPLTTPATWEIRNSNFFEFLSDFEFRISNFPHGGSSLSLPFFRFNPTNR
jgi:hypothetical protein